VLQIGTSTVVAHYETRFGFLGGQAGRAQNIARAAAQIDGVVLMPGDLLSFNEVVGPRTAENGFATAPEIYKGELRDGIGGGTCQVSGTLHAAALFGGVDIVQRSNHSRPSGYIGLGLDATVVYPDVDLRLKNPYDFALVVHATVDRGVLRIELRGRERPAEVRLSTETIGFAAFKRKVEEATWLDAGDVKLKQRGIRGISIRKTRRIQRHAGAATRERVEVTTDVYPPTAEIYIVAPGADLEAVLPPAADQPG
jgi:vancomycin resistance protein YoaR